MPDKKIIDLDGLKKFRQEADQRYLIEGEYSPKTSVGTADNLTPYGPDSGANQETPFVFQSSGGSSDVSSIAQLRELRGNTIKWNQLANNPSYYGSTLTIVSQGDGRFSVSGTTTQTETIYLYNSATIGHKYLVRTNQKGSGSTFIYRASSSGYTESFIYTASNSVIAIDFYGGQTITDLSFVVSVFDLTQMFGDGNEPISVLEFNRLFPKPYYSYNNGTLMSCNSSKIVNIGFNAFDGVLEQGFLSSTTGEEQTTTKGIRSHNFTKVIAGETYTLEYRDFATFSNGCYVYLYDGSKNYINRQWLLNSSTTPVYKNFDIPNNCHYIKIAFYDDTELTYTGNEKVCVHLTWNNERDGEYEDYKKHEYNLPSVELRSVGGVYDSITPNGTLTRRIGTRAYESGDEGDSSVITDLTNTYYVLSTPTIEQVSIYVENQEINDFGTQEFLPTDSTLEVQVPQGNEFFYPVDYKAFIDSLGGREDVDYDASKIVSSTQLQTAISNIPTPDMSAYAKLEGGNTFYGTQTFKNASDSSDRFQIVPDGNGMNVKIKSRGVEVFMFTNGNLYFKGKLLPAYPSNTGTFVLKCIDGTLTWVQE